MSALPSFSDPELARQLLDKIRAVAGCCGAVNLMEVCGTHTMAIGRVGLRSLLPENIRLLSGPGCPVCVTPAEVMDAAGECALKSGVTVLSFGDMIRVPGSTESLQQVKARGGQVEVVSSPLQAVERAAAEPDQRFVFVAVGFETTIPAVALAVKKAEFQGLENLTFLVSHRLVPPALELLRTDPELQLNGLIAPGHVSAVLGESIYEGMGIPVVVAGFEPLDLLGSILVLLEMIAEGTCEVRNLYSRIVRPKGNPNAVALIHEIFEPVDARWRGIGELPMSGLKLREPFRKFDAQLCHELPMEDCGMDTGCCCGEVLRGHMLPNECKLFGRVCVPENPVGACMVSGEGSCAAFYQYGGYTS
ncbi:hydrogenase formation protein HypD [Pontiellaceae bacterium B12227]|nr:hydrogenase formation protein HypD [Pontiellaceae bacterium B12227]